MSLLKSLVSVKRWSSPRVYKIMSVVVEFTETLGPFIVFTDLTRSADWGGIP